MTQTAKKIDTVREAVGVFHDAKSLQAAMDELQSSGFDRHEISVLASEEAIKEKLGHLYKRVKEAEDDPCAPRSIFVPLESIGEAEGALIGFPLYVAAATATALVVASGGTLLTAIMAATGAGAGGALLGNILADMVADHHADYISKQIEKGGILLWVCTRDKQHEKTALKILKTHSAGDVHVHDVALGCTI